MVFNRTSKLGRVCCGQRLRTHTSSTRSPAVCFAVLYTSLMGGEGDGMMGHAFCSSKAFAVALVLRWPCLECRLFEAQGCVRRMFSFFGSIFHIVVASHTPQGERPNLGRKGDAVSTAFRMF